MTRDETLDEVLELNKSLRHLRSLRADRQECLAELQKFIESALLSGKLSGRKTYNTERNCLSKRAVATLELEASQLKRNLFYLLERERQILSRLSEIGSLPGQASAITENNLNSSEGITTFEDLPEESQVENEGVAKTG